MIVNDVAVIGLTFAPFPPPNAIAGKTGEEIVKLPALEAYPDVITATDAVPLEESRDGGMLTIIWVAEMLDGVRDDT